VTDTKPPDIDRLFSDPATYFRTTAIHYRSMESPFYEDLARLCAEDAELMALPPKRREDSPSTISRVSRALRHLGSARPLAGVTRSTNAHHGAARSRESRTIAPVPRRRCHWHHRCCIP
jgi:hypothetical protein